MMMMMTIMMLKSLVYILISSCVSAKSLRLFESCMAFNLTNISTVSRLVL